jgi:uncharacterized membrane protein YkoI
MKAAFLTALLLAGICHAQEAAKLTIEIPAAVQQTIAKEKGETGKVLEFKRLNESDGATYAITLEIDGKQYEMILDGAGRVMRKEIVTGESDEKEIDVHKLPEAIKKTFYREAGGVAVKTIRIHDEKTRYTTEIVVNRRKYSIEVDAAGKLVSKRFEGEDDEKN